MTNHDAFDRPHPHRAGPHTPAADMSAGEPSARSLVPERAILEQLPELAHLLETLRQIDQLTAAAIATIDRFQHTGEVEDATGIPLELWLAADGRRTRSDRRMLAAAADLRARLPATFLAFRQGRISWSQLRAVVLACLRLPAVHLAHIDEVVADQVDALSQAEPDALVGIVAQALSVLEAHKDTERVEEQDQTQFVHLQPRLDGTGGRIYGDLGGTGFALVADALDPGPPPHATRDHLGQEPAPHKVAHQQRTQAQRRARRLVDLCARALADGPGMPDTASAAPAAGQQATDAQATDAQATDAQATGTEAAGAEAAGAAVGEGFVPPPVAPKVLLTMTLDQLLGCSEVPAEILTTVTGGRMKLTADAARRWIAQRGARLRGIVIEESGEILGVGRARYTPPGWLRDAILARDTTCTAPLCRASAKISHLDHAKEWHQGGRTDVANLGWLHPACHTLKRSWQVHGLPDGTRIWTHPRTGMTFQTLPTRRPHNLPQPPPAPGQPAGRDRDGPAGPRAAPDGGAGGPRAGPGSRAGDPPDPRAGPDPPESDLPF
jgi:hypothetical protein